MNPTVEMVKQLRSQSGAGVMECRKALEHGDLDFAKALDWLHEQSAIKASQQEDREALNGRLELYSHNHGRIGVMVEINTETEFASRSTVFQDFAHEIALQITASAPLYVRDEDIPAPVLEEAAREAAEKARRAGKPERIVEKIVAGALEKYKNQVVLLRQVYIRDETSTVAQLLSRAIGQIGENIVIRRFTRWEIRPDPEE